MAPLPTSTRCLLRLSTPRCLTALPPPLACTSQRRHKADIVQRSSGEFDRTSSSFESPFRSPDNPTTKVPNFGAYMSKKGETANKTFQYFMVGSMGLLAAAGAKATVQGELRTRWLALGSERSGVCGIQRVDRDDEEGQWIEQN